MKLKAQIMDEAALNRALMRIAHEITEKNKGVDNVVLVGIRRRGEPIAQIIRRNIEKIEGVDPSCGSIDIGGSQRAERKSCKSCKNSRYYCFAKHFFLNFDF